MKDWIKNNWILLGIIFVAIFFRFYLIHSLPAGLFPDEAAYAIDGRSVLHGQIQPFFERGNGREGLFMYFLALAISIGGYHPWVNHIVTASFGVVATIGAFYLTKEIFDKRTAYLAAFFMAISSYAVDMTRTAFRANTLPTFTTLSLLFTIKAFTADNPKSRFNYSILGGLFFGLGFYTYISYRMMAPLLFVFALALILANRNQIKTIWADYYKRAIAYAVSFSAAFAWIGYYFFISHPGSFVGRAGQVSVFSPDLNHGDVVGTIINVCKLTLFSFFTHGDLNWRHNVSGFPFLSPFISPMFAFALVAFTWSGLVLLKQVWQKNVQKGTLLRALLAAWFWLMVVPEITTAEGIPHGLRLIGTIPVIFILSAWGTIWLWDRVTNFTYVNKYRWMYAGIFLTTLFIYNFYLYFVVSAGSPEYAYSFRSDLTNVSNFINARNDKDHTYLSLDAFSVQTVDYLTTPSNQAYQLLVPENSYLTNLSSGDEIIFTQGTLPDGEKYKIVHPTVQLSKIEMNKFGQIIMMVYKQP